MPDVALHVGTAPVLLYTRSEVLRRAGYTVIAVTSVPEAIQMFLANDFDLVLICHSVPAPQRRVLANLVHSHSSSVPVVLVTFNSFEKDLTMDAMITENPEELLMRLPEILRERPRPQGSASV